MATGRISGLPSPLARPTGRPPLSDTALRSASRSCDTGPRPATPPPRRPARAYHARMPITDLRLRHHHSLRRHSHPVATLVSSRVTIAPLSHSCRSVSDSVHALSLKPLILSSLPPRPTLSTPCLPCRQSLRSSPLRVVKKFRYKRQEPNLEKNKEKRKKKRKEK